MGSFFDESFAALTGNAPLSWQRRLFLQHFLRGDIPPALDIPTGLCKTSVIAIWLAALAFADEDARKALPRRLVYVVERRAVVDQATSEAGKLRDSLENKAKYLKEPLGLGVRKLPISTLRGAHVDNREWLDDPHVPAIIVGTIDMIGSRLLFSGYGVSRKMRPYHAGLLGADALVVLDEAHLVPPFAHLLHRNIVQPGIVGNGGRDILGAARSGEGRSSIA
jgi:CRISPR-associated endonuclease/helicase Cas3